MHIQIACGHKLFSCEVATEARRKGGKCYKKCFCEKEILQEGFFIHFGEVTFIIRPH